MLFLQNNFLHLNLYIIIPYGENIFAFGRSYTVCCQVVDYSEMLY